MTIDPVEATQWAASAKVAVDLFKSARDLLPKGSHRDSVSAKIEEADAALRRADAALAKQLRYHLCQCAFPPRIMLWKEQTKTYECPNEACGRKIKIEVPKRTLRNPNWLDR